jgi:hypothetical protein
MPSYAVLAGKKQRSPAIQPRIVLTVQSGAVLQWLVFVCPVDAHFVKEALAV